MKEKLLRGCTRALSVLQKQGILLALAVLILAAAVKYPRFLTYGNISNVFLQNSMLGLIAVGMTFVILTGGIDLSVGAVIALCSVLSATVSSTGNLLAMVGLPVVVGILFGLCNGLIVAKLKIAPFISSLGMMMAARGISLVMTNGVSLPVDAAVRERFALLSGSTFLMIPLPVWIFFVVLGIGAYILRKRKFGRYVYAVGGNEEAAKMMGLQPDKIKILVYTISGLLAGMAGVILASRLSSGQPVACDGWEMNAIAAVAIGGTKLSGGRGSLSGTFVGVMILGVISNMINLQGSLNSWWQFIITGLLLLVVVMIQSRMDKQGELRSA